MSYDRDEVVAVPACGSGSAQCGSIAKNGSRRVIKDGRFDMDASVDAQAIGLFMSDGVLDEIQFFAYPEMTL